MNYSPKFLHMMKSSTPLVSLSIQRAITTSTDAFSLKFLYHTRITQGWLDVGLREPAGTPETPGRVVKTGSDSVYISNSYFHTSSRDSHGGAILYNTRSSSSQMLIESCIFNDCHTTADFGGAVAMNNGSCVICKSCSTRCSSNATGQFIYTYLANDNQHINKVIDCSAIKSQPELTNWATICLNMGLVTIDTVNISQNSCTYYPSLYSYPLENASETTSFVNMCSIRNNTGTMRGLNFDKNGAVYMLKGSNIIDNNCPQLIRNWGTTTITGCTILSNEGSDPIFSSGNDYTITIINCTITQADLNNKEGNLISDNWTPDPHPFINLILPTFLVDLCDVEYDFYQSLYPPGYSPVISNSGLSECSTIHINVIITSLYQLKTYIFLLYILPSDSF